MLSCTTLPLLISHICVPLELVKLALLRDAIVLTKLELFTIEFVNGIRCDSIWLHSSQWYISQWKEWTAIESISRISDEYEKGVEEFLTFAKKHRPDAQKYCCPCVKCLNGRRHILCEIKNHLFENGFDKNYTTWIWHGEYVGIHTEQTYVLIDDRVEEMIRDVGHEFFQHAHLYDSLKSNLDTTLYPGCTKFTHLTVVLKLVNVKARNGWSDKSFTKLLELLKDMFPEEFEDLHECPRCRKSRYKVKDGDISNNENTKMGSPTEVLWYLPIIPRFKRLFANAEDAKNLTWHATMRKNDGPLRHPANSPQWKKIDTLFPNFGNEARNLRLSLATDGMNPFGNLSSNHSSWPVLMSIYNLPLWLCMKRKYVMLCMMISGPRQLGNDIDVYLSPLIKDLKNLWEEGVDVFDGCHQQTFKMHAMLFCTINDFPVYGNLSGYSAKGHYACPICEEGTSHIQLKYGGKTVYTRHRKFLHHFHLYRRLKKAFNGCQEDGIAPKPLTGEQVYEKVKGINTVFGKNENKAIDKNIWKKKLIFFYLNYWCYLDVRHFIDVMHVEKNVCDSLIGTLLNIKGKTKDRLKARQDLVELGIRPQLHPKSIGKQTYLPPTCHNLSTKEETSFCQCLRGVKVPQGYSSNIKSLVSMKDLKLVGLKSHDCHVLMQQLLPVIDPSKLNDLENEAIIILCQSEMYFPPEFFYIMVHLVVHLVREIRLCGPVYLRPIKRYMKILKGYTKNLYRPETSIVERYIADEAIEFCTDYISQAEPIGLPNSRTEGKCQAESMHFSSSKDKNPIRASIGYFKVIEDIWEVDYVEFKVPVFKCKWVDSNAGVKIDELGFTKVNLHKVA
ncbi:hypothetical protein VNO78_16086 [Psophocarpus tetragonolobus]|uniref:Transposase n=1 Tax=Psophocarpus tetragonolobus TaxID=3891 RepID=A0AAN9SG70_PSOTE